MIIITVTKENKPIDHFLFWGFQLEKAIKKMILVVKEHIGMDINRDHITQSLMPIYFFGYDDMQAQTGKDPVCISWAEKTEHGD